MVGVEGLLKVGPYRPATPTGAAPMNDSIVELFQHLNRAERELRRLRELLKRLTGLDDAPRPPIR